MAKTSPAVYRFSQWFIKYTVFAAKGGLQTIGAENIPRTGGVLLAPNHVSHLDPPAVCCSLHRIVHCMAKEELFQNPFFGTLITWLAAFPVKRGEADMDSIRNAMALVEHGEIVLLFPEGTRGDGETIQQMNRGVAMLAKRTGVPIVPVAIVGTHLTLPRTDLGRKPKRSRMVVACGKPFTYAEVATGSSEKENREIFSNELKARIEAVCLANGLPLKIGQKVESPVA
ncbi:lysophospholipid acyltransferase family protein [soil metagenome]